MYRKKNSSSNPPFVDGKHNMTCLQLCEGDDLATMMTVDAVLGFTTHKMDKNYNPSLIDKKVREKWKETMLEFIVDLNYDHTYQQLIASDKIKSCFKKDERFKRHIFRFLYLFDKRSGIKVSPCDRYENEGRKGAAIFATKEWEKGSQISTLFGCIAEMSHEEEEIFHESKNEFSVMYSTRKNCSQLWLGPAAYVNHDCKPNCRFTEANDDSKMTLETLRDIHPGDELLIYYGNNFFGIENAECECFTCELRDKGLFSRNFQTSVSRMPSVPPSARGDNGQNSVRQIATRSTKMRLPNGGFVHDRPRLSMPHTLNGVLDKLKKPDETYSLRVTYSRIDRVKKRIQSRSVHNLSSSTIDPPKSAILKPKRRSQKSKPVVISRPKNGYHHSVTETPLRRSQRQAAIGDSAWGKLTIKLRKNGRDPSQYEQMDAARPRSDSNIFSRINELYGGASGPAAVSPSSSSSSVVIVDSPPFLSPWFCTNERQSTKTHSVSIAAGTVTAHCTRSAPSGPKVTTPTSKLRPRRLVKPVPELLVAIGHGPLERDQPMPAAPSDIPSYTASSPTIPVLEIESEPELAQPNTPPTPMLVCELREPSLPNSPNKGIVMKFSRIGGNKFTSLFTS